MRSSVIYQPKRNWNELSKEVKLRQWEWRVLVAFDGNRTLGQAMEHTGLRHEEMAVLLQKFHALDLLEEREVSFADFLKSEAMHQEGHGTGGIAGQPLQALPPATATPRQPHIPQLYPLPPTPQVTQPSRFIPLPSPGTLPAQPTRGGRKLNLKAVMNFIVNQVGGDVNAGQLAVYRVFMRVDTKLLKRNGITSLRFQEDRIVSDVELEEAILGSTRKALGVGCPDDVFVRD
jgi:hypothetical protein